MLRAQGSALVEIPGPIGPVGPAGPQGAAGTQVLSVMVWNDGTSWGGSPGLTVSRLSTGMYRITHALGVNTRYCAMACAYYMQDTIVTVYEQRTGSVDVSTEFAGELIDSPFNLILVPIDTTSLAEVDVTGASHSHG